MGQNLNGIRVAILATDIPAFNREVAKLFATAQSRAA
jgi:hypothetical protein